MKRCKMPSLLAILVFGLAVLSGSAFAQQAADVEGVKAASNPFYAALSANDHGEAMHKVWAHTPYVTYVGPRSKSIMVGWDALGKHWVETKKRFSQINSRTWKI